MPLRSRRFKTPPPADSWSRSGGLWRCPACGKRYPRRGQWHSCCIVRLEDHFRGRPRAREPFDAFRAAVEAAAAGASAPPVRLSIAKTRIGFITEITFASVMPRKRHLRAAFLLLRRLDSPRIVRVEDLPPYWVHTIEIHDAADIDAELRAWLREAHAVGAGRPSAVSGGRASGRRHGRR